MKKWGNLAAVAVLIALLLWAGSRFSTGMIHLLGFLDVAVEESDSRFVDETLDDVPTLAPEKFELTDQDYDAISAQADAPEDIAPRSTDYLNDGDEMIKVDETISELAEE